MAGRARRRARPPGARRPGLSSPRGQSARGGQRSAVSAQIDSHVSRSSCARRWDRGVLPEDPRDAGDHRQHRSQGEHQQRRGSHLVPPIVVDQPTRTTLCYGHVSELALIVPDRRPALRVLVALADAVPARSRRRCGRSVRRSGVWSDEARARTRRPPRLEGPSHEPVRQGRRPQQHRQERCERRRARPSSPVAASSPPSATPASRASGRTPPASPRSALSWVAHYASRGKSGDSKAQADRWGIFVGHWAPTFFALGVALQLEENS